VIVGTTDTPRDQAELEPKALDSEIEFILNTAGRYLTRAPGRADVLSVFAGLRALAYSGNDHEETKEVSRNHQITVSLSGLITVSGGKWTTYRKMGEESVDKAILVGGLEERSCITRNMPIHGYSKNMNNAGHLQIYGSDRMAIQQLMEENPALKSSLHANLEYTEAEVVWAVREEMARTVEDVLARRTRALFLDARASLEMAPRVAEIMAGELGKGKDWIETQIAGFNALAEHYILK
jgi:glycerol-3-phosphate dehydrogenase